MNLKNSLFFIFICFVWSFADDPVPSCSIVMPNKVLCKTKFSDYIETTSIYWKDKDNSWWSKTFYPDVKDRQTKSVQVSGYESIDIKGWCEAVQKFAGDTLETNKGECYVIEAMYLDFLEKGEKQEVPIYRWLKGSRNVSLLACMSPNYLRTYRYNRLTGLETDRKDYFDMRPGTYCEDFLSSSDLFWYPPK